MKRITRSLMIGLVMGSVGCSSLGRRAVLPGSYGKGPDCVVPSSPRYELVTLQTRAAVKIVAQFGKALSDAGEPLADAADRPTVLFFYGNRMSIAASQEIVEDFRRMGVNVLVPDYPGYGMSDGVPSEQGCYDTADAALAYVSSRTDLRDRRVVVAGFSIGCGVAVDLASRTHAGGLILIVPLTNTREIGRDLMPWYLDWAVPGLARGAAFDNLAKLPRVRCPIVMVSATRDQVTSERRSDSLAALAVARLERIVVDADHDGSWRAARADIARSVRSALL